MLNTVVPYLFEDFVTDTRQAESGEALLGLLKRAVARHGYDRISLWVINDPELPPTAHGRGILHNFPEDLRNFYQENNCIHYDPILLAQKARPDSVEWENYERRAVYKPAQTRLYRVARDGGLNNGLSTPIWGSRGLAASLGLASSEREDATHADLDMIRALTTQFYVSYKRMVAPHLGQARRSVLSDLTAKEKEILSWVAAGKTDDDIGQILSISRNTVDTHMRHIFHKLDASNRVSAVVKGILNGHIRP